MKMRYYLREMALDEYYIEYRSASNTGQNTNRRIYNMLNS